MVENHIQHDTDPARFCLGDQLVEIIQRAVSGVDGGIVRHIVAVIDLR